MAKKRPSVAAQVFNKPFNCEVILSDGKRIILHTDRPLSKAEASTVVTSMKSLGYLKFGKSGELELQVPEELMKLLNP